MFEVRRTDEIFDLLDSERPVEKSRKSGKQSKRFIECSEKIVGKTSLYQFEL